MRLIDVDKLENDIVENITVKAVSRMLAITQGQPTVEAIPIEWLKRWFAFQVYLGSSLTDRVHCKASDIIEDWKKENMLKAWEKENENKK